MGLLSRRTFLRRSLQGGLGLTLAGAGTLVYGNQVERGWLEVVRRELTLPRLPDAFAGFTVAQISDIHFGTRVGPADVEPAVRAVNDLAPDAVVITGDLVSHLWHGAGDMVEQTLRALRAPAGVFAVLGNHDFWEGAEAVTRALRRAGITPLRNEHVGLRRGGQVLYLAGVDDVFEQRQDLPAALAGLPADAAVVLLAHEPDFADESSLDARVILQLSGHSHGGQVCLPFYGGLYFPRLARKYPRGLYQVGGMALYTNRGLGVVGVPLRLFCRPEVTLFTLRPAG